MGWFTKIFGFEGILSVEGITTDNKLFTAKVPISTFNMGNLEVEDEIKKIVKQQLGIELKTLKIIGIHNK